MMTLLQHCMTFSILAVLGVTLPAHAARHQGFAVPLEVRHPHQVSARFNTYQTGASSDPALLLLFGGGLLGCASLCVVQSHREEKRRHEQQAPSNLVRWESA